MLLCLRILVILLLLATSVESTSFANTTYTPKKPVDVYAFIMDYECRGGPSEKSLTAYWDHKGYSIGCGTPSYEGERITREEALRRFYEYVDVRLALVKRHFPKIEGDKQTALVSLAGNNGTCYSLFRKWKLTEYLWREKCDNVRKKDGSLVELRGLHIRRNAEANLYFWKPTKK